MSLRGFRGLLVMLGLVLSPAARAAPPLEVQVEVSFLLGYIEGSHCDFFRNGAWHDSKAAQAHVRNKYNYLAARNRIHTTEDFIELAATQSSISGRFYLVKCDGDAAVTSSEWLHKELGRLRALE